VQKLNRVRARYPAISFGIPAAVVLVPAGFFLSVVRRGPAWPRYRATALLRAGAAVLAMGLVPAGARLIVGA
jgi:hypothetical protein